MTGGVHDPSPQEPHNDLADRRLATSTSLIRRRGCDSNLYKPRADHEDLVARHKYTWSRLVQMSNEVGLASSSSSTRTDGNRSLPTRNVSMASILLSGVGPIDVASGESIQIEPLASEDGASLSLFSVHDRSRSAMCLQL